MKKSKLRLVAKILSILIICLISFVGIYAQKGNKVKNLVKGFQFTKDLSGTRQVTYELSDATEVLDSDGKVVGNTSKYDDSDIESNSYKKSDNPVNKEENKNKDNYEASKNIFEKRLDLMNVKDYNLSLDKNDGKIYLQLPENNDTDRVISNIAEQGKFEIKDSEDGTVYITSEHFKKASSLYNTTEDGTAVYLHIELDKEGAEILKDLSSNEYATKEEDNTTTDNTVDETEDSKENESKNETTDKKEDKEEKESEEEEQKELVLSISGNNMVTTSFDEPIENGTIDLSMGQVSKDEDTIENSLKTTSTIVTILNSGEMPLLYEATENQYVKTGITSEIMRNVLIVAGVILAVLLVFMIIKYRLKGLLGVISYIGFVALYLLVIRYTNVAISLLGIVAIGIVLIINYAISMKLLSISDVDSKIYKKEYFKIIAKLIPILIISIIFIFARWIPLSSFGMLAFWGMCLIVLYNILVTRNVVD